MGCSEQIDASASTLYTWFHFVVDATLLFNKKIKPIIILQQSKLLIYTLFSFPDTVVSMWSSIFDILHLQCR